MTARSVLLTLTVACAAIGAAGDAGATANLGGVVSLVAGNGACHVSVLVPGDTLQDLFHLTRSTACLGGSASAEVFGIAAAGSVGLRATSSGNGLGSSSAAAQVQYSDQWTISVPPGTPNGTINLPLSLRLDGSVSPGAIVAPGPGTFLQYSLAIGVPFSLNVVSASGGVSAVGPFSQTFNGIIGFNYTGQPLHVAVEMNLLVNGLYEGTVDFYNTAAASVTLPSGYSATTSSGLPLPEPSRGAALTSGLLALALAGRVSRRGVARR